MTQQVVNRVALQVVLHGMSERALNTFSALFASPSWRDCVIASRTPPDIGIVDLDTPAPERTWSEYRRRHPDLPTVVLSIREQTRDNSRYLRKPVSAQTLRATIDQMRREILGRRAIAAPALSGSRTRPMSKSTVASRVHPESAAPRAPLAQRPPPVAAPSATHPRPGAADIASGTKFVSRAASTTADSGGVSPDVSGTVNAASARKARTHAPFAPRRAGDTRTVTRGAAKLLDPGRAEVYCGNAPDVPIQDLAGLARIVYDPRGYFQGTLERAITAGRRSGQAHAIAGLGAPFVVMPGRPGHVLTMLAPESIRALCGEAIHPGRLAVNLASADDVDAVSRAKPIRDEALLWVVALWSGRGRLRRSIATDTRIQLIQWPNFTRLVETPEAMRIAAALATAPGTPLEVAARLRIPQRYVYSFVSAARAIGLIERVALDAESLGGNTLAPFGDERASPSAPRQSRVAPIPRRPAAAPVAPKPLIARILARLLPGR